MRHLNSFFSGFAVGMLLSGLTIGLYIKNVQSNIPASDKYFEPIADAGFSPHGRATDLVLQVIDECEHTLNIAAYDFTSKQIADALIAKKNKLQISIVADKRNSKQKHSVLGLLQNADIPVRVNGHYAIHHNKFMICDNKVVETGSFNYTASATKRNAENVLVIWYAPELAQTYMKEWNRLWDEADAYIP